MNDYQIELLQWISPRAEPEWLGGLSSFLFSFFFFWGGGLTVNAARSNRYFFLFGRVWGLSDLRIRGLQR